MPVMDLLLEKAMMLRALGGLTQTEIPTWHFPACPTDEQIAKIRKGIEGPFDRRLQANVDAVRYIAEQTKLIPVGMSIGPFSLMTKLISDPITPVYLAGTGLTGKDDDDVKMIETLMELTVAIVLRSFKAQAAAGAKIFFIAEPAANKVYISPNQMAEGSDVFERMVLKYLRGVAPDAYQSADRACERLEKRVRRYKSRLRRHGAGESPRKQTQAVSYVIQASQKEQEERDEDNPIIIAEAKTPVHEMAVADAVMQMDLSDQPFVVFRNASHGEINVVYRREDGNIGWIDPATPVRSSSEAAAQKKSSRAGRETATRPKAKMARGRR
jgi:hypothetical protein